MTKCGVNQQLYTTYTFDDHIWSHQQTRNDDLLELAERCIKTGGIYHLKHAGSKRWVGFESMQDAKKQAKNTWVNNWLKSGTQITAELVDTFFDGSSKVDVNVGGKNITTKVEVGSCPNVQGRMVIPYGPQFLRYNGMPYVNVAQPTVVQGDQQHLRVGLAVLRMVYRSLCNGPALSDDATTESEMLLEQIVTNKYTQLEFRFVMNWLAAIVQTPGINLQTNLWIVGQQQGIGKGTLLDVMRAILGSEYVGALNQAEIDQGEWNDHLFGKVLIEVNEFDSNSRKGARGWDKWIKSNTCEPELNIRQRNHDSWTTLNIGNYIFTTNDENPVHLDSSDRRNMIVKTTNDPQWKEYASQIKRNYTLSRVGDTAKGFACILEEVKVDLDLIMSAPMTQAKADIQTAHKNSVDEWVHSDSLIKRDEWQSTGSLYDCYKMYVRDNLAGKTPETLKSFGALMTRMSDNGSIDKKRSNGMQYLIPAEVRATQVVSNRAQIVADLNQIVGADNQVVDNDAAVILPNEVVAMTPAQRLRAALIREHNAEQDKLVDLGMYRASLTTSINARLEG